jgi:RimJ/RimL family protein N-acetyltransferase
VSVLIRDATPADERALRELDLRTWSSLSSPAPPPPPEREFDIDGVLVAEHAGTIAGYVKLGPLPLASCAHVREIKGLAVDPGLRRRGVGKALVQAAIERAKRSGARRLVLRVLAENTAARALYAACGFEVEGVLREHFFLDGRYVDDILMARRASPGRL